MLEGFHIRTDDGLIGSLHRLPHLIQHLRVSVMMHADPDPPAPRSK